MQIKECIKKLEELNACGCAIKWSRQFTTAQEAWDKCERGDWALWLIGKLDESKPYSDERKPLVSTCLKCARLAWEWMPKMGKDCIELYEKWVNGEKISVEELKTASAAYAADAASAAYAAYAATLNQCADIVRENYPNVNMIPEGKM